MTVRTVRSGLLPLRPDQFGRVDEVSYPPSGLVIEEGVEVSAYGQEEDQ